ncbi:MAG: transposase [Deltaproteobacteria bacterium]|jgi:putative transposase|nr:transposase [Deltaproteobacteria bacterium]
MILKKKTKHKQRTNTYTTRAIPVYKNQLLHLTRRTSERRFFLTPNKETRQICEYCLATAAQKHKILVHAYIFMSNHYHLLVTDTQGRYPAFLADLNRNIAKCMNVKLGRKENFWNSSDPGTVRIPEHMETIVKTFEYIYLNPASAFLVSHLEAYPGAKSRPGDLKGKTKMIRRPAGYFSKEGRMPAKVKLSLKIPAFCQKEKGKGEFVKDLQKKVRQEENRLIAKVGAARFMGRRKLKAVPPFSSPRGETESSDLNPKVSGKSRKVLISEKSRYKNFRDQYEDKYKLWKRGDREVVFPAGTYGMVHFHGARVASSP